ncbi:CpaF family protein [Pseudoclavibacter sp. AY1H1]|uniref:CpaF family protein n=1 Tax=Pseudoclavibacter sp. AY1H1 TaxID=2080584 RepID=UPI000CE826F6|nr:type II/IV secretion system ATPase subunit [Pseudoclavibacter sp. AY1H1]PPF32637.1 CpaF family protein [Pseudoclavibacter sp. AY1H1]
MSESVNSPADIASLPLFLTSAATPTEQAHVSHSNLQAASTLRAPSFSRPPQVTPASTTPSAATEAAHDSHLEWDLISQLRQRVSELLSTAIEANPGITEAEQHAQAQAHILEVIEQHIHEQIRVSGQDAAWSMARRESTAKALFDGIFKLGRLQPLVDDPMVENIDIYGDQVWVSKSDGSREQHPPIARNDAELVADIAFLAQRSGNGAEPRNFTSVDPLLDMDLPGGARLAAVHPVIAHRPKAVIRVHRLVDVTLESLVKEHGTLTSDAAAFLTAAVEAGHSVVVAGLPGAGKTTLVRALAAAIPAHEKIVTIEKERELYLERIGRNHIVTPLQYRPGQGEMGTDGTRAGAVTLVELLEESLRLDATRIIVGEVRGGEVDAMFQAMQAGAGSISTIHALSPTNTVERLASLSLRNLGSTDAYAYRQIAQHIDLVVQIQRVFDETGRPKRRVTHIAEIQPGEIIGGVQRPIAADLFARSWRGAELERVARPTPHMLEAVEHHGYLGFRESEHA